MKDFFTNLFGFLYTLSMGDYIFLTATFLLILALIYIIYLLKKDDFMEERKFVNKDKNDALDIIKICESIESDYKPGNIELTSYEEEQENNAIISYEELIKNKQKLSINYDENYTFNDDELSVRKISVEEYKMSDKKEKEIELKVKLMHYDKEEAFLQALKQLQQNLMN